MRDPFPVEPVASPVDATVGLPGSKSITNRALVCAALAEGPSTLVGALDADDTRAMSGCLRALGVGVEATGGGLRITPADGPWAAADLDARQSGTTSRFVLPLLGLDATPRRLDGDAQLRARPMGPSLDALRALGATVDDGERPGHLPVVVHGPMRGGTVSLPGDASSQFLSGLLLAAPVLPGGLAVELTTELVSRPYVEMTGAVMAAFGAAAIDDGRWYVPGGGYRGTRYVVEPDASAASYVWAAAVLTGGRVTVPGLHRSSLQGDVAFAEILASMGAEVVWHDDAITVAAGDRLRGVDVDMSEISDTVPTLAVVAAVAEGPTTMRGIGFIRDKESDRIAAPVAELRRCGVDAVDVDEGITIRPRPLRPATFETYRDHRMAMAFSLLGLVCPGMAVRDPGCVAKTFPGWWDLLHELREGRLPPARRGGTEAAGGAPATH